jgi:sRNA-binding regulator protein Hfq
VEASSRKLIRPPLKELQEKLEASKRTLPAAGKPPLKPPTAAGQAAPPPQQQQQQKAPTAPPEQTNAENFYFAKQIQMKTPMVVVLRDGEQVQGTVEWYDKHAFRLARPGQPSVMIYKLNIKYMFKAE